MFVKFVFSVIAYCSKLLGQPNQIKTRDSDAMLIIKCVPLLSKQCLRCFTMWVWKMEKPTVCNGLSCSDGPAEEHLGQHKVWWWCRMNGSKSSLKVTLIFRARRRRRCWLHGATVAAPGHRARPTLPQPGGVEEHLGGVPLLPSFL